MTQLNLLKERATYLAVYSVFVMRVEGDGGGPVAISILFFLFFLRSDALASACTRHRGLPCGRIYIISVDGVCVCSVRVFFFFACETAVGWGSDPPHRCLRVG